MGAEEFVEPGRVKVKYKGTRIRHFEFSRRRLRAAFNNEDASRIYDNLYNLCDYIVYSLREEAFNLSVYGKKGDSSLEIVQGSKKREPRITVYELGALREKNSVVVNISSCAPKRIARNDTEHVLQIIGEYIKEIEK